MSYADLIAQGLGSNATATAGLGQAVNALGSAGTDIANKYKKEEEEKSPTTPMEKWTALVTSGQVDLNDPVALKSAAIYARLGIHPEEAMQPEQGPPTGPEGMGGLMGPPPAPGTPGFSFRGGSIPSTPPPDVGLGAVQQRMTKPLSPPLASREMMVPQTKRDYTAMMQLGQMVTKRNIEDAQAKAAMERVMATRQSIEGEGAKARASKADLSEKDQAAKMDRLKLALQSREKIAREKIDQIDTLIRQSKGNDQAISLLNALRGRAGDLLSNTTRLQSGMGATLFQDPATLDQIVNLETEYNSITGDLKRIQEQLTTKYGEGKGVKPGSTTIRQQSKTGLGGTQTTAIPTTGAGFVDYLRGGSQ